MIDSYSCTGCTWTDCHRYDLLVIYWEHYQQPSMVHKTFEERGQICRVNNLMNISVICQSYDCHLLCSDVPTSGPGPDLSVHWLYTWRPQCDLGCTTWRRPGNTLLMKDAWEIYKRGDQLKPDRWGSIIKIYDCVRHCHCHCHYFFYFFFIVIMTTVCTGGKWWLCNWKKTN